MKTALIDTNILIDHLKGRPEARACLQECLQQKLKMACSVITRIELLSGMRPEEEHLLELFLSGFDKIEVTDTIAGTAGKYLNQYRKSHGINMAEAIIAATAQHAGLKLYTLNVNHYPMDEIEVYKPY